MKSVISPFQLIEDGDMGADITSEIVDVMLMDNIGLQISWTNNSAVAASKIIQDLTYTADATGAGGNAISIEYVDPGSASQALAVNVVSNAIEVSLATSAAVAASKIIQDLTYTADSTGVAGNDITITYVAPRVKGSPLSAELDGTDIVVSLGTSYDTKAELVEQDLTYIAKQIGPSGNDVTLAYIDPAVANSSLSVSVVGSDIVVNLATDGGTEATGTLNLTTDIILTASTVGTARNTDTFETIVNAAAANPTDTVLVDFAGTADAITCTVTPNNGTNNGATPVPLTTAELVELINTGAVAGKTITLTDVSGYRILQTATGGDATDLTNGGEGDNVVATFSGGTNYNLISTASEIAESINASTAAFNLVQAYVTGTGSNVQAALAETNLAGGGLSTVISTASQIKTLLDAIAEVAALVNITVSGTGSNIQVGQDETALENGAAYNLTSTASQIKTAVDADVAAAALVNIVVSGTGTNVQTVQAETFLENGTTGGVTGVISVQGSNNWNAHLQTGEFYDLTFDPALAQPNSNNGGYLIGLDDYQFRFFRVFYDRTSGDGLLNVSVDAKQT